MSNDLLVNRNIGNYGAFHIINNSTSSKINILTHCNTGTLATSGYGTALGCDRL